MLLHGPPALPDFMDMITIGATFQLPIHFHLGVHMQICTHTISLACGPSWQLGFSFAALIGRASADLA